ncbi:MAG: hypothetical protein VW166_06355 [Gammaproteobacteria bacterium]
MNKAILSIFFLFNISTSFAMTYGDSKKTHPREVDTYITGVIDGLEFSQKLLESSQMAFYCKPKNLQLTMGNAKNFIENTARDMRIAGYIPENYELSFLIFDGLKTTFPCNQAMQEGAPQSQY